MVCFKKSHPESCDLYEIGVECSTQNLSLFLCHKSFRFRFWTVTTVEHAGPFLIGSLETRK